MTGPLTIALAGHANVGKTSLVSALTRDATLLVAEEAGTTRSHYVKTYAIAGEDVLSFVDTPGFEFASRINRWLDAHGGEGSARMDGRSALSAFLEDEQTNARHDKEKEALRGALKADVIAYVADVTHTPEGQVVQEVRLLRRAGVPMVGVLNNLHRDAALADRWVEMLRTEGVDAIVRLDAMRFPADQERSFYDALGVLRPEHKATFTRVEQLRATLDDRHLVQAAVVIAEMLVDCASFQHRTTHASEEEAMRHRSAANHRFKEMLREREQQAFAQIAAVYGFGDAALEGDSLEVQSWSGAVSDDLFDAEALRRYGLSTVTLAAVGGITGTALDALSGGLTFGVPTLLGTLGGAAAGLWLGRRISTSIEAGVLTVGPVDSVQFPAMLLHRAVECWRQVARRSHADRGTLRIVTGERQGLDALGAQGVMRIASRCGKHPEWSGIGGGGRHPERAREVDTLSELTEKLLRKQLAQLDGR
jgi:GTP-binding protein EngB required for normal cell division